MRIVVAKLPKGPATEPDDVRAAKQAARIAALHAKLEGAGIDEPERAKLLAAVELTGYDSVRRSRGSMWAHQADELEKAVSAMRRAHVHLHRALERDLRPEECDPFVECSALDDDVRRHSIACQALAHRVRVQRAFAEGLGAEPEIPGLALAPEHAYGRAIDTLRTKGGIAPRDIALLVAHHRRQVRARRPPLPIKADELDGLAHCIRTALHAERRQRQATPPEAPTD